jgi:Ca2+-binding EF-hand superfamily protein
MPLPVLLLPILAAALQAPEPQGREIVVEGRPRPPFISPMGEAFRVRSADDDTLADWFHQADRNHDGALTPDEMQADADRFFAKLDTEHDNDIDPEELVQYEWEVAPEIQVNMRQLRARPAAGADGERRRGRQRREDEPSNGTDGGLQGAARYALLNIPEPVAAADTNFDRSITLTEFRQAAIARFRLLDTDHQGRLTLQQLEALRPAEPPPGRRPKRKDEADTRYAVPLPPGN